MKNKNNSKNILPNNRLFKETLTADFGPIETCVEVAEVPQQCPNPDCRSTNIRRKGKTPHRRVVLHSDNSQLKRIILLRHRCECRDCKSTFYPSLYNFNSNAPLTLEAENSIVKTILEHPTISVNSVAKSIENQSKMSSSSAVNRLIKMRVHDLSDAVQLVRCSKLFYIPFKYKSRKDCCAIVGLKKSEKKLYLLDILPGSSANELDAFFEKAGSFLDNSKLFLADMNRDLLNSITTLYSGRIGVLRGLVSWRIDAFKDKHFSLDKKYEALEALKKVVQTDLKEKYYYEAFENWEKDYLAPNPELAIQLQPLYDEIISYKKECFIGTYHRPWEPEFTMLRDIIKTHERNNVSFDFMAFRLLYANGAATGTLDGAKIARYVQNIYLPIEEPIRSFGIDITTLYIEIFEEEYFLERLYED